MVMQGLSVDGEREQGQDVRTANVTACVAIANIVKSSLGPVGLDKMLVDQMGDVTVTNDGATILKLLEVEHPSAKLLVELAQQQDEEFGDGTAPEGGVGAGRGASSQVGRGSNIASILRLSASASVAVQEQHPWSSSRPSC